MFSIVCRVSGPIPPATSFPVLSVPIWPERYSMSPTRTADENGSDEFPATGMKSSSSEGARGPSQPASSAAAQRSGPPARRAMPDRSPRAIAAADGNERLSALAFLTDAWLSP